MCIDLPPTRRLTSCCLTLSNGSKVGSKLPSPPNSGDYLGVSWLGDDAVPQRVVFAQSMQPFCTWVPVGKTKSMAVRNLRCNTGAGYVLVRVYCAGCGFTNDAAWKSDEVEAGLAAFFKADKCERCKSPRSRFACRAWHQFGACEMCDLDVLLEQPPFAPGKSGIVVAPAPLHA
jgi:hypothetical protein